MHDAERFKLIRGPYRPPRVRRGQKFFCEIRGTVTVGGYSDGPTPWPRIKKGGNACLILCGDLVKAVRVESGIAVAHHFGVSTHTVAKWRQALDVPEHNEGTRRVHHDWALGREDDRLERGRQNSKQPAALAKLSEALKGRVQSPKTIEAVRKAAQRPRSQAWKDKIAATWRRRGGHVYNPNHRHWTDEEDAMLGTARDREVAKKLGRTLSAVQNRRFAKGISGYVLAVDGKHIQKLRRALRLERSEVAEAAELNTKTVWALEAGKAKGIGRHSLRRIADALGVALTDLVAEHGDPR